jgi:hypothetical protein
VNSPVKISEQVQLLKKTGRETNLRKSISRDSGEQSPPLKTSVYTEPLTVEKRNVAQKLR